MLAYAGLRPQEALALRWGDVRERTLLVERAVSLGKQKDTKTHAHRTVRLLAPLREDLLAWRLRCGPAAGDTRWCSPGPAGGLWTKTTYENWRKRAFDRALQAAAVERRDARTTLRHSFASLLLHEGRSVIYVARQLGHDARLTLSTYGHVIDELDDAPRIARRGRDPGGPGRSVCHWCVTDRGGGLSSDGLDEAQKPRAVRGLAASGARGTRTPDLLGAIQALSQLSYSPEVGAKCSQQGSGAAGSWAADASSARDRHP